MSATIPSLVTLVVGLFGLAGLAGGLLAFLKSKLVAENVTILERTNEAQDNRIRFLEAESERQKADLEEKSRAIKVLENVVTGHEQLATILESIKEHDAKLTERDRRLFGTLEEITLILEGLKEKVSLRDVQ